MTIDHYKYWTEKPPEPSPRLAIWVEKIKHGWKMNKRFRKEGYDSRCQMFGVYMWEYFHVLCPLLGDGSNAKELPTDTS